MSGLVEAKKYAWLDSNLALFGSDLEKKVKKASAATEKAWENAGQRPGIQIWRIVKFKVTDWPKEDYGKFFSGDSYVILRTYKKPNTNELLYNIHFWIGKDSTQDEYDTAAYKTIELDEFLDDKPVQHREVQDYESDLFRSYFKGIRLMKGGAESSFRHVEPTKYKRLFQFRREKGSISSKVMEVDCFQESLDSDDVFIFDAGLELYQWNGKTSNKDERFAASQFVQNLKSERGERTKVEILEEDSISPENPFNTKLPTGGKRRGKKERDVVDGPAEKKMYKVSDDSGKLHIQLVSSGDLKKDDLRSEDVFVVDQGKHVFVWIGSRASKDEKRNAFSKAHSYLLQTDHPLAPITVIIEGKGEWKEFDSVFE